jgi:HD-GYP domain-containing protein (c-di-GMP phosphodiesterase class II)
MGAEAGLTRRDGLVKASWTARPHHATALRLFVAVLPFGCAILAGALLVRLLPAPTSTADEVLATLLVAIGSMVAYVLPQRAARRLLPLAALLELTLVFPDVTPSRFGVALRAQSARRVKEHLRRSLEGALRGDAPSEAPVGQAAADLVGLLAALTLHDPQTRGHSERVRAYTAVIAKELHLEEGARNRLAWAALLHDVGKIAVPPEVLRKVTPLTDEEWTLVRAHTVIGDRLVQPLTGWLGEFALVPLQHHERWDGSGYPSGLSGEQISRGARIVAVADAFDVMISVRSYCKAQDPESARRELVACSGQQFDPAIVRAFLNAGLRPASSRAAALVPVGTLTTLLDALQIRLRLLPPSGAFAAAGGAVVAAGLSGLLPVQIHPVEERAHAVSQPVAAAGSTAPSNEPAQQTRRSSSVGEPQVEDGPPVNPEISGQTPSAPIIATPPTGSAGPAPAKPHVTPDGTPAGPTTLLPQKPAVPAQLPPPTLPLVTVSVPPLSLSPVLPVSVSIPGPVSVAVPMALPAIVVAPANPAVPVTALPLVVTALPLVGGPPLTVPPVTVPTTTAPPVTVPPTAPPLVGGPPLTVPPPLATVVTAPLPVSTPGPVASVPTTLPRLPGP